MTFYEQLSKSVKDKKSCLCVGLDPNPERFPEGVTRNEKGAYQFLTRIIESTAPHCVAFKPQIAYFSAFGWESILEQLISDIHKNHPGVSVVLDAKRGDIGATAEMYAVEAFERYKADSVTLNPYMGWDSIKPFLSYPNKGTFILCRTSNPAAEETQNLEVSTGDPYYVKLAKLLNDHAESGSKKVGWVVGATAEAEMKKLREQFPAHWFLVPGVGAQGGSLEKCMESGGFNSGGGVLVNSSRGIIYAGSGEDYGARAEEVARKIATQMKAYL